MSWICSVKASTANFEMLKAMKEAGCHMIRVGVESGVQEILDRVKKDVKIRQISQCFSMGQGFKIRHSRAHDVGYAGRNRRDGGDLFSFYHSNQAINNYLWHDDALPGTDIITVLSGRPKL